MSREQYIRDSIAQHEKNIEEMSADIEKLRRGDTKMIVFMQLQPPTQEQIDERIEELESRISEERELVSQLESNL